MQPCAQLRHDELVRTSLPKHGTYAPWSNLLGLACVFELNPFTTHGPQENCTLNNFLEERECSSSQREAICESNMRLV